MRKFVSNRGAGVFLAAMQVVPIDVEGFYFSIERDWQVLVTLETTQAHVWTGTGANKSKWVSYYYASAVAASFFKAK